MKETIEELLEKGDEIHLEWVEPRNSKDKNSRDTHADVTLSATVNDCVGMMKALYNSDVYSRSDNPDREMLLDFMAINNTSVK